jgi:iron complex outermembrane receptor protein
MHRSRFGTYRSCTAAALLLLLGSSTAVAQDDPAADLPADDLAPEEAPPDAPAEPQEIPDVAPAEGEVGTEASTGVEGGESVAAEGELQEVPEVGLSEPMTAEPKAEGDIVVTGSRIKRSNFAQPSAVAVVDRKTLQLSGANNMAEVARTMNINYGSEVNADVSGGSTGTAQFNLRGLGLSSTLVLLNGRRLVQSAALAGDGSNYVDINTLPMQMVERIEVLKGGASATYGSDAVAGVVNVITRRNYDGFEAQVGGQTTDKLDQHEWDVSLVGGAHSETSRVMATVAYMKREPLLADDRDFTHNGKNTSQIGWPGTYLPVGANGAPIAQGFADPGCQMVPLSMNTPGPPVQPLPFCSFNFNSYYMLVLDEQRINTYATVEHDISDHTMVFFEGGFARNNATRILSPSFAILQPTFIPADNQYNPYNQRLRVYARLLGGNAPPLRQTYNSDTLHTVAGISGDFGGLSDGKIGEWEWEIAGTYDTNRYRTRLPDQLKGPLQNALNSCNPASDPANCLDLFYGGEPLSQPLVDKITGEVDVTGETELTTLNADINGPIVKLPGGNLALALGTQVRREVASSFSDHDSNQFQYIFLLGSDNFAAERKIYAGYAELSLPFFEGFEAQAAGRLENYSDVGSAFNPMFGISWTPAQTFEGDAASQASKVRVRGTFAQSFRAPSLLQTNGSQTALERLFASQPDMMTGALMRPTNATFLPVRTVGNPNLDPQTSTAITGGLEWSPVVGMLIQADYWNYDYKKIIVKEAAQTLLDKDFAAANPMNPLGNLAVHRDPLNRIPNQVDTSFINASSVMTHGIDLELAYRDAWFGPDAGVFSVGLGGSYVLAYKIPKDQAAAVLQDCSGDTCDVAGVRNKTNFARPIPRMRATLPLTWALDGHSAGVIGHFISGYKDDEPQVPEVDTFPDVDAYFSFDLQYSYRIDEGDGQGTTFRVGVLNIANAYPPVLNTPLGYDTEVGDPRGRMVYGRIIQEL